MVSGAAALGAFLADGGRLGNVTISMSFLLIVVAFSISDKATLTKVQRGLACARRDFRRGSALNDDRVTANQPAAASFMILTIVSFTSYATPSSCDALNIARREVGFKVARTVLPPSS